jgi:hypothetical protein
MRTSAILPALCLGAGTGVYAQTGVFEVLDFNITEALLANGINVSSLPELAPLVERTLFSGCSIAVSTFLTRVILNPY